MFQSGCACEYEGLHRVRVQISVRSSIQCDEEGEIPVSLRCNSSVSSNWMRVSPDSSSSRSQPILCLVLGLNILEELMANSSVRQLDAWRLSRLIDGSIAKILLITGQIHQPIRQR